MTTKSRAWRTALLAAMLHSISGCAGFLQPELSAVSMDFEPPSAWRSGIRFWLGDPVIHHPRVNYTTRVEFVSAGRGRIVTNRDLFTAPSGYVVTPWYQVSPKKDPITLRITVEHPGGARSTAEYPLFVKRGEFYSVGAHVHTRQPAPSHLPYLDINPVSFPLNPKAGAPPGDSLWVSFSVAYRECFNCPT